MGIIKQNSGYRSSFLNIQLHSSSGIYFSNIILNSFAKIKLLGWSRFIKRDSLLYLTLSHYLVCHTQKKTRQIFIYNFLFPWIPKEFFFLERNLSLGWRVSFFSYQTTSHNSMGNDRHTALLQHVVPFSSSFVLLHI